MLEVYRSNGVGSYAYEANINGREEFTLRIGYFGTAYILASSSTLNSSLSITVVGRQVYT